MKKPKYDQSTMKKPKYDQSTMNKPKYEESSFYGGNNSINHKLSIFLQNLYYLSSISIVIIKDVFNYRSIINILFLIINEIIYL